VLLKGSPVIQTPKPEAARRSVKLSAEVVAALRKHRLAQTERRLASQQWVDGDLVFCTRDGKPINPNNVYRNYLAIIAEAGVPRINLHGARHTQTTLALASGAPLKADSERLGHTKTSITLDTYSRVVPNMQDQVVEAIDAALFRESSWVLLGLSLANG
jgi:integrase